MADDGPTTLTMTNPLVAILGISEFLANDHWTDLAGVTADVETSVDLWSKHYHYDTIVLCPQAAANADSKELKQDENEEEKQAIVHAKRTKIYPDDIDDFIVDVRTPLINGKYDGLVFMVFGHGQNDAVITSNCGPFYYDELKQAFNASHFKRTWAAKSSRFFVFDTCRGSKDPVALTVREERSRGSSYNPRSVNKDSNIIAYHSTTKEHKVGDQGEFMQTFDKEMRQMSSSKHTYTLYDMMTKIGDSLNGSSFSWYCPEIVSTNRFKLRLEINASRERGEVTYCELDRKVDDDEKIIVVWDREKQQKEGEKKTDTAWFNWKEDMKQLFVKYSKWTAVVMGLLLFYYIGRWRENKELKWQVPLVFREPLYLEKS